MFRSRGWDNCSSNTSAALEKLNSFKTWYVNTVLAPATISEVALKSVVAILFVVRTATWTILTSLLYWVSRFSSSYCSFIACFVDEDGVGMILNDLKTLQTQTLLVRRHRQLKWLRLKLLQYQQLVVYSKDILALIMTLNRIQHYHTPRLSPNQVP